MKNRVWEGWLEFMARRAQPQSEKLKSVGLPPGTTPSKVCVSKDSIIDAVSAFVRRFVFLKDESLYLLVAVWIVASYLVQEFDYAGYLFAYSPEPQSGKTTLLDVLDLLVANSSGIQIAPTPATMFRTADGKTQLLDEIDTWMNHEELRSVLNAGFQKGAKVSRVERNADTGFKAHEYSVYGPKALAGIGLNKLTRATRDRTFALSMVRQTKAEKRTRLRRRLVAPEANALKKRLEEWARKNRDSVVRIYHDANFPYLNQFGDRTMDIADPLAAVVEVAFEEDSRPAAQEKLAEAIRTTRNEQQSPTSDHRILRHLFELTETEDPLVGNATELAKMCGNLAEPPNEFALGHLLHNYGFKPESNRKPGENPKWRYVLHRSQLQEVVDRWAVEPEQPKASEASNAVRSDVAGVVPSTEQNARSEAKDPG